MSLAAAIKEIAQLHGTFVLRSGKTSTTYFDKYRFESEAGIELISLLTSSEIEAA